MPNKEEIRRKITEREKEQLERLSKVNSILDFDQKEKAFDEYMTWRISKHIEEQSEFKKWLWTD